MKKLNEYILEKNWEKVQEYIDVDSVIDGFLVKQITKDQDIDKSSIYYYKD